MNYETDLSLTVCVTNSLPYDKTYSRYDNKISYSDILILYTALNESNKDSLKNSNLLLIYDTLETDNLIMFKFLCSSDCNNGDNFLNQDVTIQLINFIKKISERKNTLIEFSDHSLGSFIKNWDQEKYGKKCPIKISDFTISGPFNLSATKDNFLNSSHCKLITMAKLSDSNDISIQFNNMDGTKVYEIIEEEASNIKVLSTGNILKYDFIKRCMINIENTPVHSEFKINEAIIIVSSTHWCNLDTVETPINIDSLRTYTLEMYGDEACDILDEKISKFSNNPNLAKRALSDSVRDIVSGKKQSKISKLEKLSDDDE